MQTIKNKKEEINYNKGQSLDSITEYIERCFKIYPFESYYSHIHSHLNRPNMNILEMGCGNGFLSLWLEKKTKRTIYGTDISKEFINTAHTYGNAHGYQSQFILMDIENSGLKPYSFDLIIMLDVLHHFPDTEYFLKEVYRSLKNNGVLIVFEPNPFNLWIMHSVIKRKIIDKGNWGFEHEKMFSKRHYTNSFKSIGFDIVESKTIRYIPKSMIDEKKYLFQFDELLSKIPIINSLGFATYICARKR